MADIIIFEYFLSLINSTTTKKTANNASIIANIALHEINATKKTPTIQGLAFFLINNSVYNPKPRNKPYMGGSTNIPKFFFKSPVNTHLLMQRFK